MMRDLGWLLALCAILSLAIGICVLFACSDDEDDDDDSEHPRLDTCRDIVNTVYERCNAEFRDDYGPLSKSEAMHDCLNEWSYDLYRCIRACLRDAGGCRDFIHCVNNECFDLYGDDDDLLDDDSADDDSGDDDDFNWFDDCEHLLLALMNCEIWFEGDPPYSEVLALCEGSERDYFRCIDSWWSPDCLIWANNIEKFCQ